MGSASSTSCTKSNVTISILGILLLLLLIFIPVLVVTKPTTPTPTESLTPTESPITLQTEWDYWKSLERVFDKNKPITQEEKDNLLWIYGVSAGVFFLLLVVVFFIWKFNYKYVQEYENGKLTRRYKIRGGNDI